MKLKEIALSIYYEPYVYGMDSNNYSSKEEYLNDSRIFFHEVLFPIKKQFIMETRNIASFFSRLHFENYKNNQYPFSKLIVSCCRDKCSIGRIINVDGIAEVRILYDYTGFRNKNAIQKKHDALQIIMNGLYVVANEFLLDTISFKNIESMIISCDYKNIWTWSSKWNKNRKYNASVYVDHDVDSVIIGMKIVDKSGTMIYNKKILTTKPDEWDYAPFLGKLFWQNNNEAVLLDKNDKVVGKWSAEQFSVYRQKPIEEIEVGDKVLSEDETTGEVAVKTVTETYINETDELIHIGVNGETISATPSHPFYVDKLGWTLARSLKAGDVLVLSNGELVTVEWVQHEILESPIKVYNFEVQDFHTYFVGECGVLVHNWCQDDIDALRNGKDYYASSVDEAREMLDAMPELSAPPLGKMDPFFSDPKGTYRGDLLNAVTINEKGEKVLADYIHPPNKVTKHKAHSQNPHYNLYFPDGTKSAIIIDMDQEM